ncbi:MAG: hypothetical protein V4787_11255 [Pseudomonadota bacterium]
MTIDSATVSLWRARVQIALWRRGWAWTSALVLLAAACASHLLVLQPLRHALAATKAEIVRERSAAGARPGPVAPTAQAQDLATLQAVLSTSPEPAELVRTMASLAQAEQIAWQQGDYQQQPQAATRLVQVQVTQPVHASYPQLRRYVEAVLRALPNASLDQVTARRENVGQAQIEARLRWTLWLRKDSPDVVFTKPGEAASADKPAPRDLFGMHSWNPPPPPPLPPQPAPPPTAPPVPYTFLGKKQEGDAWEVFLAKGEQTFVVRAGGVIESDWRIDGIDPPTLALTYLPLGLPQTISIGDAR